ncbi:MAG: DNA-binding protein WhiA [Selenomonadaceae bacterium]|nr:DNA-binding protein WhiA [Selenomonadaceae bacterium]
MIPSYAQEVKNELAHRPDDDIDCLRAEFVALLKVGTRKFDARLEFANVNGAVARRVIMLAKKFLPNVKPEVATVRRKTLRKNLVYVVRFVAADVQNFFDSLDFAELLKRTRYKVAYLRGAFLARGTVNRPEGKYLLSIVTFNEETGQFVYKQLRKLDFKVGIYERKKNFVVYLYDGDSICDFLGMVGADNAVERFEVARNLKEVRMQVNRIVNLETAALNKSIDAAQRQLADIKILLDNNVTVKERLQTAMTARLENPSANLRELAEKIHMTEPGLLYRFKVIHRLAEKTLRRLKTKGR